MQRLCWIVILLVIFAVSRIETATYPKDVEDLKDIQRLVLNSQLELRGWTDENDPCGDMVPCGINHLQECNWEGLACVTEDGSVNRVVGIAIEGQTAERLNGTLPVRLPENLETISLAGNALHGDLFDPECFVADLDCTDIWWRNEKLVRVDVEGNDLEGPLPEWKTLKSLQRIQLSRNRFSGKLPETWSEKIHLNRIELSGNALEGGLPESWSFLYALHSIRLAENLLHKEIPDSWFRLPSLAVLDISGNCGICGIVPNHDGVSILGNGTNLNTKCSSCDGCDCKRSALQFVLTNVLLSITVLFVMLFVWVVYRCLKSHHQSEVLPVTDNFPQPLPRKPIANPTIVINPDQDVCICCQIDEKPQTSTETEEISTDTEEEQSSSDQESSDYSVDSDNESLDPKVLAFLYKTSPMLAIADRSWSEEIAGPSEIRPEGYASDLDSRSSSSVLKQRRSKSALGGLSKKTVSRDFMESRTSAKRITDFAPTPTHPKNKHRRRRVRTFRRKNRRGLAGDFRIAEPQKSIRIPKDLNVAIADVNPDRPAAQDPPSGSGCNNQ